jgi:TolB-like protein
MSQRQFRIGRFTLQPHRELLAGESPVPLGRKALEILTVLAEAEGSLVTKDELMAAVWPNVTVEDNAIQVHIAALRKALGAEASHLQTVRSLGYRLARHDTLTAACPLDASPMTVAVLPFANLTGDTGLDYLGDGLAEELINTLAHVPGLQVSSRTSSSAYKGHDGDVRQIARELGVEAIVEGSVRKAGDTIRITAQLADAESGFHRWSENYDRKVSDLLAWEDELASIMVPVLAACLYPGVTAMPQTDGRAQDRPPDQTRLEQPEASS